MVFAPMQTGAETSSDIAEGRRVTRQFLPTDTLASLPPHPYLGASSGAGQPRTDEDSWSPRVSAVGGQVSRRV